MVGLGDAFRVAPATVPYPEIFGGVKWADRESHHQRNRVSFAEYTTKMASTTTNTTGISTGTATGSGTGTGTGTNTGTARANTVPWYVFEKLTPQSPLWRLLNPTGNRTTRDVRRWVSTPIEYRYFYQYNKV